MFILKKKPHMGKRRFKVEFYLTVKNLCFTSNEYFMRNSFYSLYLESDKNHQIRSRDILYSSSEVRCIAVDEVLKFSSTLFIDVELLSTDNVASNDPSSSGFDAKEKKLIIRQTTNLPQEEIVYKDVGYIILPLDKIIQNETITSYSFPIIDSVSSGYVQASLVCKFLKEDKKMIEKITRTIIQSPPSPCGPTLLYSEIFKESVDEECFIKQMRDYKPQVMRISSDDERFAKAWMQDRNNSKVKLSFIVDKESLMDENISDENDVEGGEGAYKLDYEDKGGWNSIGGRKVLFISPTIIEGDELEDDDKITESEFDHSWRIGYNKCFIVSDPEDDDDNEKEVEFDKHWDMSNQTRQFISNIAGKVEEEENDIIALERDEEWDLNLSKIKANFMPSGPEEDELVEYASQEIDQEWCLTGLKKPFCRRSLLNYANRAARTDTAEDSDLGELDCSPDAMEWSALAQQKKVFIVPALAEDEDDMLDTVRDEEWNLDN